MTKIRLEPTWNISRGNTTNKFRIKLTSHCFHHLYIPRLSSKPRLWYPIDEVIRPTSLSVLQVPTFAVFYDASIMNTLNSLYHNKPKIHRNVSWAWHYTIQSTVSLKVVWGIKNIWKLWKPDYASLSITFLYWLICCEAGLAKWYAQGFVKICLCG